ncbi:hypothetical protein DFH06DRAFT_1336126 [Mycena polygramma]|nr:hypothetical protein DFH06DRAFT_1336126 [Mycena polygramma]
MSTTTTQNQTVVPFSAESPEQQAGGLSQSSIDNQLDATPAHMICRACPDSRIKLPEEWADAPQTNDTAPTNPPPDIACTYRLLITQDANFKLKARDRSDAPFHNNEAVIVPVVGDLQRGEAYMNIDFKFSDDNQPKCFSSYDICYVAVCFNCRSKCPLEIYVFSFHLFLVFWTDDYDKHIPLWSSLCLSLSLRPPTDNSMADPYHCEPPIILANPNSPGPLLGRKLYLVMGKHVKRPGAYESWPAADVQYKGVSAATLKGYYDHGEMRYAWRERCDLGEHPHPVAPTLDDDDNNTPPAAPHPPTTPVPSSSSLVSSSPLRVFHIDSLSPSPSSPSRDTSPPSPSLSPSPSPTPSHRRVRSARVGARPSAPPPYTQTADAPNVLGGPAIPAPLGTMAFAVRDGGVGEAFTSLPEARARYLVLQAAGRSPGFVASASVTRCLAWIADTSVDDSQGTTVRGWVEEENRARRQRVADQWARELHRQAVLDALAVQRDALRNGGTCWISDSESDTSRSTDDLEAEMTGAGVYD